jgi:hypothetical protein
VTELGTRTGDTVAAREVVDRGTLPLTAAAAPGAGAAAGGTPPAGTGGFGGRGEQPLSGELTAVDGDRATLRASDGSTLTVTSSTSTTVTVLHEATVADLVVGEPVQVEGVTATGGTASAVLQGAEPGVGRGLGAG